MSSSVITDSQRQLTLSFDADLVEHYRSVRDVVAAGVYRRGLKRVAADLDLAPGNLSVALSDDGQRKFGVDELERYLQATGDLMPVYYLVSRYLGDQGAARDHALAQVGEMLSNLPALLAAVGVEAKGKRSAR